MYVDVHAHCFEIDDISRYSREIKLVCVSDDLESTIRTLHLSQQHDNIVPCAGVHPWVVHEFSFYQVKSTLEAILRNYEINCLGEVGLDKKFKPDTFERQLEIFNLFLNYAKEYDLVLNIHAANAWKDVLDLVRARDVSRAVFHWFTGPHDVLGEIEESGYYIGANPAWQIQSKHRDILRHANLNIIITESDAPYVYRGLRMVPDMVRATVDYIAEIKGLTHEFVKKAIYDNFIKLFK